MQNKFFNKVECATSLNITRATLDKWIAEGKIITEKITDSPKVYIPLDKNLSFFSVHGIKSKSIIGQYISQHTKTENNNTDKSSIAQKKQDAELRKIEAEAAIMELKLQKANKEVVPIESVQNMIEIYMTNLHNELNKNDILINNLISKLHLNPIDSQVITNEILQHMSLIETNIIKSIQNKI